VNASSAVSHAHGQVCGASPVRRFGRRGGGPLNEERTTVPTTHSPLCSTCVSPSLRVSLPASRRAGVACSLAARSQLTGRRGREAQRRGQPKRDEWHTPTDATSLPTHTKTTHNDGKQWHLCVRAVVMYVGCDLVLFWRVWWPHFFGQRRANRAERAEQSRAEPSRAAAQREPTDNPARTTPAADTHTH
jgi:hypothetical protein